MCAWRIHTFIALVLDKSDLYLCRYSIATSMYMYYVYDAYCQEIAHIQFKHVQLSVVQIHCMYSAIACNVLLFETLEAVAHCVLSIHFIQNRTTDAEVCFFFCYRTTMFVIFRTLEIMHKILLSACLNQTVSVNTL